MPDFTASAPNWFVQGAYLNEKVKECSLLFMDGRSDWTNQQVLQTILAAGQTPYSNFVDYGNANNVSPSPYFVVPEYLAFKARQLNSLPYMGGTGWDGNSAWTMQQVLEAFDRAGLSAWDHYTLVGQFEEGVNPSNSLDQEAFWENKVEQLNSWENPDEAVGFDGKDDWTVEDVQNYFRDHGLNAIMNLPANSAGEQAELIQDVQDKVNPGNWEPWGNHVWPIQPTWGDVAMEAGKSPYILGDGSTNLYGFWTGNNNASSFQDTDRIEGGPGNDTVSLAMNGNFLGFSDGGYIKNVEQIVLTNESAGRGSALVFNAHDVIGTQSWAFNCAKGPFTVQNLQTTEQMFTINNAQGDTTTNLQFVWPAISSADDSMGLALNSVGNAATGGGAAFTPARYAQVVVPGVETLNVVPSSGDNYLDLAGNENNIVNLNVGGVSSIHIRNVDNSLANFDALTASGNIVADLQDCVLGNVRSGAGNDHVFINGFQTNPVFDGGAGDGDTLTFYGSSSFAPTMSNFETLDLYNNPSRGEVTIDAANVSGLKGLQVYNTDVAMFNMDGVSPTLTVTNAGAPLGEDQQNNNNNVVLGGGAFDLNYMASGDPDSSSGAVESVGVNLTAGTTGSVTIADSANAALGGGAFNIFNAGSVTIGNTSQSGDVSVVGVLNAPKATALSVTANGSLIVEASDVLNLGNVAEVDLHSDGAASNAIRIDAPLGNAVGGDIDIDVFGAGSLNLLGQIGGSDTGIVNVDAGRSSGNIHGELEGRARPVSIFAETLYYTGAWGDDNISAIASGSGTIINSRGGDDSISLTMHGAAGSGNIRSATINAGQGNDSIQITGNTLAKSIVNIEDWTVGNNSLKIGNFNQSPIGSAEEAKKILRDFGYEYVDQLQDAYIQTGLGGHAGSFTVTAASDLNGTYFVDSGLNLLVHLLGVDTQAELNQGTVAAL